MKSSMTPIPIKTRITRVCLPAGRRESVRGESVLCNCKVYFTLFKLGLLETVFSAPFFRLNTFSLKRLFLRLTALMME